MSEVANGVYRARAVSAALGRTGTGKEQVAVTFQLMDSEGALGPMLTWFGYFTEQTFPRTVEGLRHCGWQGDDLSDLSGIDANEVSLVVENEEYEGKTYSKIRWVNAAGGGGVTLKEQLTDMEARAFGARMRGQVTALRQAASTPRRAPSATSNRAQPAALRAPEPPPHTDDDLPF